MATKIRFYLPKDYREGKKDFKNSDYLVSELVNLPENASLNEAFMKTSLGKMITAFAITIDHYYWKDAITGEVYESAPETIIPIIINMIACPGVDVILIDGLKLHLKYFFIPTFKQLKIDLEKQYGYKYLPDIRKIHEKLIHDDCKYERKMICL